MTDRSPFDSAIVGGGIVGLAVAYQLGRRFPGHRTVILEKEDRLAAHQTGHNSGVLHSGIYYRPGSLKARTSRIGGQLMREFCQQHHIPCETCGKVIVALDEGERESLMRLFQRGVENGVRCEWISAERLKELEPHAAGVAGIHVPETGILDYGLVCQKLAHAVEASGGEVRLQRRVVQLRPLSEEVRVTCESDELLARHVVNCAGLFSDRVARQAGWPPPARIIPFRGEYYELRHGARRLCRNLIYPVPDPRFPFLGVHLTRRIDGTVECGPNAVLALAREGYSWGRVSPRDLAEIATYPGTWRMARKYWRTGLGEVHRSLSKTAFVKALRRLVPELESSDLERAPAGVRAQAVSPSGDLVDDFVMHREGRVLHVCNAPSPAATASLQIANQIVDQLTA